MQLKKFLGQVTLLGSLVIPIARLVHSKLERSFPVTSDGKKLKNKLLDSAGTHFLSLQKNQLLCIATMLDPKFKKMYISSPIEAASAVKTIATEVKQAQSELVHDLPTNTSSAQGEAKSIWSLHDETIQRLSASFSSCASLAEEEVKLYLQLPNTQLKSNTWENWVKSRHFLPALSLVALKYLTIIGSSVSSERLISSLNDIISNERSTLTDAQISQRVFLANMSEELLCNDE